MTAPILSSMDSENHPTTDLDFPGAKKLFSENLPCVFTHATYLLNLICIFSIIALIAIYLCIILMKYRSCMNV